MHECQARSSGCSPPLQCCSGGIQCLAQMTSFTLHVNITRTCVQAGTYLESSVNECTLCIQV